jgi:hypothetical protein
VNVFRQAGGFESIGPVGVVLPPCQLSLSDRSDRGANDPDFCIHVFAAPVVSEQDHDTVSGVYQLFDRASVCLPRLEPVEPAFWSAVPGLETERGARAHRSSRSGRLKRPK